jgi:hypothetical protein
MIAASMSGRANQFAEVGVGFAGRRELLRDRVAPRLEDVAGAGDHDVGVLRHIADVAAAHAVAADQADLNPTVGAGPAGGAEGA